MIKSLSYDRTDDQIALDKELEESKRLMIARLQDKLHNKNQQPAGDLQPARTIAAAHQEQGAPAEGSSFITLEEHRRVVAEWRDIAKQWEIKTEELNHEMYLQKNRAQAEQEVDLLGALGSLLNGQVVQGMSPQAAQVAKQLEKTAGENARLRARVPELESLLKQEKEEARRYRKEAARHQLELGQLKEFLLGKESRMDELKKQTVAAELSRVEVLKVAMMSVRDAALKFQEKSHLAEQAVSDNQLLKEELGEARKVLEGFKEKAKRLTHMKKELADAREELGVVARQLMQCESKGQNDLRRLQAWCDHTLEAACERYEKGRRQSQSPSKLGETSQSLLPGIRGAASP